MVIFIIIPFFYTLEMDTYLNIGDQVSYRNSLVTLTTFIGYRLATTRDFKVHLDQTINFKEDKKYVTEIWIGITDKGSEIKVHQLVPIQYRDLRTQDEYAYSDRLEVINDCIPDPITRSREEVDTGVYNLHEYKKWHRRKMIEHQIFLLKLKHFNQYLTTITVNRNKTKKSLSRQSKASRTKTQLLQRVHIYLAMVIQQRTYPTIRGYRVTQRFLQDHPEVKQEYNKLFNEFDAQYQFHQELYTRWSGEVLG